MQEHDQTIPIDLHASSAPGPVAKRQAGYLRRLPPCNAGCPAGENIQAWLAAAMAGDDRKAWEIIVADNPFPAIHGRVCYHPCETVCCRGEFDEPVNIHAVERYLGDRALAQGWALPAPQASTGKRVLVIGAGPSGLSAAYHLRRRGHAVTVFDAGPAAGGMMQLGIPRYRLPRDILAGEVARIEAMGVEIRLNHKVNDLLAHREAGHFQAIFIAIGAQLGQRCDIPARDAGKVYDALSFLRETEAGRPPRLGRRVAIYGGGNTAMDTARTVKRLGIAEPLIIYRRDAEHMPAHPFEAEEAMEEGVKMHWLRSIREIDGDVLEVEVMALDETGRPVGTGEFETLNADSLILALGQRVDSSFLHDVPGLVFDGDTVQVDAHLMTNVPGVFAGGDAIPGDRSVTVAVGHGKKAALCIDAWLHGCVPPEHPQSPPVTPDMLQLWYAPRAQQQIQPIL
ncbi:MAG: formate dehydrogenase beta subunit, partial [Rhodothermales bacterium]